MENESQAQVGVSFDKALKADGSIDKRSSFGKAIRAMRSALQKDLTGTTQDILEGQIAGLMVLEQHIIAQIVSSPQGGVGGEESQTLLNFLLRFQGSIRAALNQLAGLQGKGLLKNANGKGRDLDAIDL